MTESGYRISHSYVYFFNSNEDKFLGVEFRLLKGEITDYGQACYEFESKQELQQIWYDEGYTKNFKTQLFQNRGTLQRI